MRSNKRTILFLIAISLCTFALYGCGGGADSPTAHSSSQPSSVSVPGEEQATMTAVRFLEDKIKGDPQDFIAHIKLANYYLQFLRESGNSAYLDLASRAGRASLEVLPAEMNPGGLSALAQVEIASHDFAAARDHALLLTQMEPRKSYPYEILADALLELGQYDEAGTALRNLERFADSPGSQMRLARFAFLRGQTDIARKHLESALALISNNGASLRETLAWCQWQLGETAFSTGEYDSAERYYLDALNAFPNYSRALASLGRVRAARGDLPGAIARYQQAMQVYPDPAFAAALGDIFKLSGNEKEAADQYALVEQVARLSAANGSLYNRQLALFYADHDLNVGQAYEIAAREYEARKDIYGADVLAWTALKAGKIAEAQAAIKEALRLGTRDARLFYHAGMIARAAGDARSARDFINRALKLNPGFDPLQASIARKVIEESND